MPRLTLGIICGLVYGALSAASMIPLQFPDKRAALLGAFINRFSIGFVIGAVTLPWPGWAVGLVIGVLLSGNQSSARSFQVGFTLTIN
jgi:hypothetical protein